MLKITDPEAMTVKVPTEATADTIRITKFTATTYPGKDPTLWVEYELGAEVDGAWSPAERGEAMVDGAALITAMLAEQDRATLRTILKNSIYSLLADELPAGTVG